MSPVTASRSAARLTFLQEAETRYRRAALSPAAVPGAGLGLGPIRESAADVPELIALARAGLRAQTLLEQHAGWAQRLERTWQLHEAVDRGGGELVCQECTRPFATALWPCTTMQVLYGLEEP